MSSASVSLFANPTAGRGRTLRRLDRIGDVFKKAGVTLRLCESRAVGDLEQQVCNAVSAGSDKIVVVGGDGSVHEAVNGIMLSDHAAALGVIPSGTGNDFAKACAVPLDWVYAAELLAGRIAAGTAPRRIDVGRMNERYFANGAGIGFDARVTHIARAYRLPIGDLVYLLAIFRCMIDGIATPELRISAGDQEWNGPVTLANVSNGPWVGGMFHIAPMANNADGQLELLIADPVSRTRLLSLLPLLMRGAHMEQKEVTHSSVRELRVSASAPVPSHLDGETQALTQEFHFEVMPDALDLL